jgi:hypothetical protein
MFSDDGGIMYTIHCIEFQKCGLLHAHIVIKYHQNTPTCSDLDHIISDEVPNHPDDASLV